MMKDRIAFRGEIESFLGTLDPNTLMFNRDEYWMIFSVYEYLEYFAFENRLRNTSVALPLARGIHDGSYRKATVTKNGSSYRLPYVIHCLLVCRMLADLRPPLSHEELDVLLASALCHDMLEDVPFRNCGRELIDEYGLDPRVYETVKLVTKRRDFTEAEEASHFHSIEENKLALLVKLSDRSQNVEDLYNMSVEKVHEYVGETKRYILPMCSYGLDHYPELRTTLEILQDKILCLTETAQTMVDHFEAREQELLKELKQLRVENSRLFAELKELWGR